MKTGYICCYWNSCSNRINKNKKNNSYLNPYSLQEQGATFEPLSLIKGENSRESYFFVLFFYAKLTNSVLSIENSHLTL